VDLADYVLSKFTLDDRNIVNESIKNAVEAVSTLLKSGVDAAMNKYNK
jgi:PTH1 family peptidyl-tRNA hydrolase